MMGPVATDTPIGTRIRKRRQILRMTQEQLAGALGVSKSAVANWERGRHFPLRYLGAIEDVLGISLEQEEAEPEVPESLRRTVAALTPRQREWMRDWLARELREDNGDDRPRSAQA